MKKQFLSILLIFCLILSNSYMVLALDGNVPVVQADESEDELEALDYVPPQFSVTGISPDTINFGEQPVITITGKNLTSDMAVWLGTEEVTGCTANAAGTQLTFTAPQLPVGTYSVNVTDGEDFVMLESAVLTCVDGSVDVQFGTPAEDAAEFEIPVTLSARGEVTSLRAEISIPKDIFAEINVELSDAVQELDNVPGLTSRYNKATEKLIVSMAGSEDFNVGDSEVFTIRLRPQSTQTPFNIHVVVETVEVNGISVLSDSISIPVTIYANYALSASVKYYKDRVGVEGVKIYADNAEGLTNANGDLELSGIHGTDITVHAVKKDYIPHTEFVIGTNDALMILRYTVGEIALTDQQKMAADVDANGRINEVDASLILKYAVGLTRMFPAGPWKFIPAEMDMTLQPEGNEVEFTAILMGDVDGSYSGEAYEGTVIPNESVVELIPGNIYCVQINTKDCVLPEEVGPKDVMTSAIEITGGEGSGIRVAFYEYDGAQLNLYTGNDIVIEDTTIAQLVDDEYDYQEGVHVLLSKRVGKTKIVVNGHAMDVVKPLPAFGKYLAPERTVENYISAYDKNGQRSYLNLTELEDAKFYVMWDETQGTRAADVGLEVSLDGLLSISEVNLQEHYIEITVNTEQRQSGWFKVLFLDENGEVNFRWYTYRFYWGLDQHIFDVPAGAHLAEDSLIVTRELIEDEDTLIDLHDLLGQSISYYYDDLDRIVAVDEVQTTAITGKLNADWTTIGDFKISVDCDPLDYDIAFYNGYESDYVEVRERTSYTWNVIMKDGVIVDVVSVMDWEVNGDSLVRSADLAEIFDEEYPNLFGIPFKLVDSDAARPQIDYSSFELEGVMALEDIKTGNVVYVYAGGYEDDEEFHIVKIQVGKDTVSGIIDEVTSTGKKIWIDDHSYAIASARTLDNAICAEDLIYFAKAGNYTTAYLDYFGNFYYLKDKEEPESNYCVVLKTQVVDDYNYTGGYASIDQPLNKIKVFSANGEEEVYLVNARKVDMAADSRDGYFWWEEVEPGAVVKLAFDANGKVSAIRCVEMDDSEEIEVRSDGIIPDFGAVITDASVIFYFDGDDDYHMMDASRWSVLDPKLLWGKEIDYMRVSMDERGKVKAAVVFGNRLMFEEHVEKYGIIKSYSEIKDYAKVQMLIDGEAVTAKWSADECDFDLLHKPGQQLYRISLASNEIVSVDWFEPDDERTFISEEITGSAVAVDDYSRMFVNMYGENLWLPLAEDCVVYVFDRSDKAWFVKTVSYLDGLKATKYNYMTLYDTNRSDKEFYNVVVVVRE